MKWSLLPKNKIDTVQLTPILNVAGEEQTVHTETFTDVQVGAETFTLPISNDLAPTHWRNMRNSRWVPFETFTYAKASVECVMATGSRVITLDQAVTGTLSADIVLNGTSSVITRGGSTFDTYPAIDNLAAAQAGLSAWIESNKTVTNSYLSGIYTDNSVWMNPWIRKVVPVFTEDAVTIPTANDILTNWVGTTSTGRTSATFDSWSEDSSFGKNAEVIEMLPANAVGDPGELLASRLKMRNLSLSIACTVEKIDNYNFRISWSAPVRLSYMAASCERGPLGGTYDVDNSAFVDNISSVTITLYGQPYDTSKVNVTYGYDSEGMLVRDQSGMHPIKIDAEEAFTTGSYYYQAPVQAPWTAYLSDLLLGSYMNGKYIVECDVPAQWALQQSVCINKQMQVCLQDGTFIQHNGTICTFAVKNIEKKFKDSEFTYSLKLMEV
jgi:hypothetical protein